MAKPPTLGDRLTMRMAQLHQSADGAAVAVGATPAEVEHWVADLKTPGDTQLAGIADYLVVDATEVRRLVLRSRMRRVQRDIRGESEPAHAGT